MFLIGVGFGVYVTSPSAYTQLRQLEEQYLPKRILSRLPNFPKILGEKTVTNTSSESAQTTTTDPGSLYEVTHVVDGDTIEISTGQKVRYIGIDTPELHKPETPVQCYAIEARNKNRDLVEGKKVKLIKDVSEVDKYGRLLRYVYAQDKNGEIFVNDYLVKEGYANASAYPPDVQYNDQFKDSERQAREANKGLWSECK